MSGHRAVVLSIATSAAASLCLIYNPSFRRRGKMHAEIYIGRGRMAHPFFSWTRPGALTDVRCAGVPLSVERDAVQRAEGGLGSQQAKSMRF